MNSVIKRILFGLLPCFGFGDRWINLCGHPYALARTALRQALARLAPCLPAGPLLDVGCGTMPYRSLFARSDPYEGLEIDQERNRSNSRVTYFYDGTDFPLPAAHYASVLCSQVLEHSFCPEQLLGECHRVLRPGGVLLLTIPFIWPEHEQPWDSQRFTRFGLSQRLEAAGFYVVQMLQLNPGLSALLQLGIEWNESLGRQFALSLPVGLPQQVFQLIWRLIWALPYSFINLLGVLTRSLSSLLARARPCAGGTRSSELYLDLVVMAAKRSGSATAC